MVEDPADGSEWFGLEAWEQLQLLFETTSELAIVMLDPQRRVVSWNAGAERLLGHPAAQVVGLHVSALNPPNQAPGAAGEHLLAEAEARGSCESDGWLRCRDGSSLWVALVASALRDDSGRLRGFATILRDASMRRDADLARRRVLSELEERATTDALTGLKNRREFDQILRTSPRAQFSVLAIDVDKLKQVNDEYGHDAGDVLLRSVATTLTLLVRGWDVLARLGGDEFAAMLPGAGPDEAAKVAERMRVAMHGVPSGHARISVGWASGVAGTDPHTVWSTADQGLYAAKRAGGDRVETGNRAAPEPALPWGPSHDEVLSEVLAGGPLSAVYQPIMGFADGHVIGYEALARPAHFAPSDSVESLFRTARKVGRIRDLDWRCRRAALGDASVLPEGATLFMNVSTTALLDPVHDVDQLLMLLRWAKWPPVRTVLELSGHERFTNLRRLTEVLASYRHAGLRFAFDSDRGHSTAEVLAAARPEFLKVDRSLTMTATRRDSHAAIEATVSHARLNAAVTIAVGVESQLAAEHMEALGIAFGQGYGMAKPIPANAVTSVPGEWAAQAVLRPLRPREKDHGSPSPPC